jgi:hypothetical protein
MTGTQLNVLVEQQSADAQNLADLDRLTVEELREYRRLEAKSRGIPEVIEIEAVKTVEAPAEDSARPQADRSDETSNG